ncbi:hypothetical protein M2222_004144 [Bradyrhizobium elkanii]|nr:hypothetical protein [Bradyrhizobium elkanii]MCS3561822.1 hypothetical protein [Bradyrhizobium elkanii]MCW2148341.1 hypothetical protein [Bradyrhizobium elkanii]MCW2352573.1 hypothetical protein [Bradyrhizobium elkanii]MCW2372066.1 hypothetical protein [Bradyrhizobium elkanii]
MFSIVRILVLIACAHAGSVVAEVQWDGARPSQAVHVHD